MPADLSDSLLYSNLRAPALGGTTGVRARMRAEELEEFGLGGGDAEEPGKEAAPA